MTGTTSVNTSNTYDSTLGVERISKDPVSSFTFAGNITVTDSASNTLSVLPVWWDSPDYDWIQLHPNPDAAITYNIRVEMRKPPLVNDSDWPEIDQEFHDILIWGVTQDLLPTLGKASVADRTGLHLRKGCWSSRRRRSRRRGRSGSSQTCRPRWGLGSGRKGR